MLRTEQLTAASIVLVANRLLGLCEEGVTWANRSADRRPRRCRVRLPGAQAPSDISSGTTAAPIVVSVVTTIGGRYSTGIRRLSEVPRGK
jgi:hypothetical protein